MIPFGFFGAFRIDMWHRRLAGEATALGLLACTGETPVPHSIVNCFRDSNNPTKRPSKPLSATDQPNRLAAAEVVHQRLGDIQENRIAITAECCRSHHTDPADEVRQVDCHRMEPLPSCNQLPTV